MLVIASSLGRLRTILLVKSVSNLIIAFAFLVQDEVQIVPEKLGLSRDSVKSLLNSFIKSNPELAGYYSVTEFEDIFVVSIQRSLAEMVANCEMCRYIASSEGDLVIHKRTHGWIFIL